MGFYDVINGTVLCPYCGKKTRVTDQIKWTEDPVWAAYKIGDKIDAADGEYIAGSWARETMHSPCDKCGEEVHFAAIVKDEILVELRPYIREEEDE